MDSPSLFMDANNTTGRLASSVRLYLPSSLYIKTNKQTKIAKNDGICMICITLSTLLSFPCCNQDPPYVARDNKVVV